MNSGVYLITCSKDPRFYVGESIRLSKRLDEHKRRLRAGTHVNHRLQAIYNLHGEQTFTFRVAIRVSPELTKDMEQVWIEQYFPAGLFNLYEKPSPFGIEAAARRSKVLTGRHLSAIHRSRLSIAAKNRSPESYRLSDAAKERLKSPLLRKLRSESAKRQWANPLMRDRIMAAQNRRPAKSLVA